MESKGEAAHAVKNPATNEVVGMVPEMTNQEFDDAVSLAKDAFQEWKNVPLQQRQRIMLKLQQAIRENTDDLAYLISLENGKTLADAQGDVFRGLEVVESACWMAPNMMGDTLSGIAGNVDCVNYREPLGVTAGVCPFNFPAMSKYQKEDPFAVSNQGSHHFFSVISCFWQPLQFHSGCFQFLVLLGTP